MGKILHYASVRLVIRLYAAFMHLPIVMRYYEGIAVQAKYLYRTSDLYRLRWEACGIDYADECFRPDSTDAWLFFQKARRAPIIIRMAHLRDALLSREPRPYELES